MTDSPPQPRPPGATAPDSQREVLDVTGWLGGYNFQWAWASGHACAEALAADVALASG